MGSNKRHRGASGFRNKPIGDVSVKSRRVARRITSEFHEIQNELYAIERAVKVLHEGNKEQLKELEDFITENLVTV